MSLYVVSANGGAAKRLVSCGSCGSPWSSRPAWSPNGRWIAFSRDNVRPGRATLLIVAAAGGRARRLTHCTSCADITPTWSPNGHLLLFSRSWSPDGKKLQFFNTPGSPSNFRAEVWTMNADGSGKTRLYHSGCCVGTWAPPIWSPDGRMIAFSADSAGGTFVDSADGSGLRELSPTDSMSLSWQRRS